MARQPTKTQETWEDRITRALKLREEWERRFRVELSEAYFEGHQNPGWPEAEWINVNKIYSRVTATLPTLVDADPYFYVKLSRSFSPHPMDVALMSAKADIRQAKLNHCWREIGATDVARLSVQDAQFWYGIAKVHYSLRQQENPRAGQPIMSELEDENGERRPLLDENGEPLIEPDMLPSDEKYHVTRVDPADFVWGEESGTLAQKWTWIGERFRISRDAAKKDLRFRGRQRAIPDSSNIDVERRRRDPITNELRDEDTSDDLEGWEIYDLKNRRWMITFVGGDRPAMDWRPFPPGVEDHPYAILRFTLRRRSPYPIPPVSQALDPQRELSESRSRILRHRKRFNRKYEVNVHALIDPDDDLHALEAGDDGTVVRVQQQGAVSPINDAPLDQQTYIELGHLNADIVEVLGPQSADLARADSATAAALMDKGEAAKEADRKSMVVAFVKTLARKLDMLIQANLTTEEAIQVSGPSGVVWQRVGPEDYAEIEGEYEYGVSVGAAVPRIPQVERAQFLAVLNQLAQFPHLLTSERMMDRLFEMHQIDDDVLKRELMQIGQQILSGQTFPPGGNPQQANPIAAALGGALGSQGGITGGGGASQLTGAL